MNAQHKLRTEKYLNLDFARGMAALLVLAGHLRAFVFLDYSQLEAPQIAAKIFYFLTGLGHQSVMIFFVLSGFLVSLSIRNSIAGQQWSWVTYGINRLSRLWTVLIPTLFLTLFWDSLGKALTGSSYYSGSMYSLYFSGPTPDLNEASYSFSAFLQNIFFLQTVTAPTYGTNGPLWSLANEFWYYIIFPLAYLVLAKQSHWANRVITGLTLLVVLWFLPVWLLLGGIVWLLGYVALLLYKQNFVQRICSNLAYVIGSIIIFIGVITASRIQLIESFLGDLSVGLAFLFLMLGLLNYKLENSIYRHISEFFSQISYTLYLTHFPFLAFISCFLLSKDEKVSRNGENEVN